MTNRIFQLLLFMTLLTVLAISSSCESCRECGPDNAYPYFKLTVLNRTSLDTLNLDVTRLKAEIKEIDTKLADIANAGQTNELNALKAIKSDSLAFYNSLVSTVNRRLISIAAINSNEEVFTFEEDEDDSLINFGIPIDPNNLSSNYIIEFEGSDTQKELSISYTLVDTLLNSKITKAAKNLQVIYHDFDSLRGPYGCTKSNCISNKQTIYVEI